jgi:hypothetical protein
MNEGEKIAVHTRPDEKKRLIDEAMIPMRRKEASKRAFFARLSGLWREAAATL